MRYGIKHLALLFVMFPLLAAGPAAAQSLESPAPESLAPESLGWDGGELVNLSAPQSAARASLGAELVREIGFGGGGEMERGYPGLYFRAEALFWHRNRSRYKVLSVDDNETFDDLSDDVPYITTKQLDFEFEPGYRLELGRSFGNGLALEGTFYEIRDFNAQKSVTSNGLLINSPIEDAFSPPTVPDFSLLDSEDYYNALQHRAVYTSQLINAEMNLKATWRHYSLIRSEFVGFRYMQVHDRLNFETQDDRLSTPADGLSNYENDLQNNLYGVQYGQEVTVPVLGALCFTGHIKTGLYANSVEQSAKMLNNGGLVVNVQRDGVDVAAISELGVNANIKLTEFLTVRGGYNMMWVDGVALAPDQFTFVPGQQEAQRINDNGDLFYQGFNIGIELVK